MYNSSEPARFSVLAVFQALSIISLSVGARTTYSHLEPTASSSSVAFAQHQRSINTGGAEGAMREPERDGRRAAAAAAAMLRDGNRLEAPLPTEKLRTDQ